jgi:arylsulfatase A-like enzyme
MQRRPNLIWFLSDQQRGQSLSCMGDPDLSTPNFDRLGIQGLHFPNAVSCCPWCSPFRASLITGLHAHRAVWRTPQQLDPALPTIVGELAAAGYRSRYLGKWHLDGPSEPSHLHAVPRQRRGGFDEWLGYENNNNQEDCWLHGHGEDGAERLPFRLDGFETDCLVDMAIERLEREAQRRGGPDERPFFLVVSVQPPHNPYLAPAEDMARHRPAAVHLRPNVPPIPETQELARRELAGYHAQIENLDRNLGRLLAALDRLKLADDTWFMAFSDHGDMHHAHGYREKSVPYEESIRIPFFLRGHRRHRTGRVPSVISTVDIAPTSLGLCGLPRPTWMDGYDFSPWITAPWDASSLPDEPESAFLQHLPRKRHPYTLDRPWRGVVTRDGWKYVCIPHAPLGMYDLNRDPYELDNLAFKHAFIVQRRRLHGLLTDWIARTGDAFDLPEL